MTGLLTAIHIAPVEEAPMEAHDTVQVDAGQGIVGDRYYGLKEEDAVSLIEESAVQETASGVGVAYVPGASRRNFTIANLPLNDLIGQRFTLGEVLLEGTRLAHPCHWMEQTIGPGAKELLLNRGGIRARVLQGGTVRVGDILQLSAVAEEE
ncbi:MAG: hypothetical protein GEEBNDBF_02083 [bacterium]|nr:hypothetical protein [bacterium]